MHYLYCPICGNRLIPKPAGDDGDVPFCLACNAYRFDTFPSVSIVMVVNEFHEIAMLRQLYLSDRYWTFVSGFIKPGETAEETAVREVSEELGLQVRKLDYAGTYWFGDQEELMHAFIGHVLKSDFVRSIEVDAAEWVPYPEAPSRMFPEKPGNTQHPIYRQYLQQLEEGLA